MLCFVNVFTLEEWRNLNSSLVMSWVKVDHELEHLFSVFVIASLSFKRKQPKTKSIKPNYDVIKLFFGNQPKKTTT